MNMDNKKLAAAVSAVFTYIKTSEEAAYYTSRDAGAEQLAAGSGLLNFQPANLWGISGRQAQMQANTMMQMRAYK